MALRPVTIYDFSRLCFVNTTLSKRKLAWFVENGHVTDWTDPRFPTVTGIMRRGMTVGTLMEFMLEQGPTKSTVLMEWDKIWATNRKNIDPIAGKYTALEKSKCCLLTLTDLPEGEVVTTHPVHPKNGELGDKAVFHSNKLYLESDDVAVIKEGDKITLMKLGNVIIDKIITLPNGLYDLQAHTVFADVDFKNTTKLTWLIANDAILVFFYFLTKILDKCEVYRVRASLDQAKPGRR
jgi:glutamyl-tRNA synthetase